jgi:hypothetical protein
MTWPNYQMYRNAILKTDLKPSSFGGILSPDMLSYLDQTQAYSNASFSIYEKMIDGHDNFYCGNETNPGGPMAATTSQSCTLTSGSTNVTGVHKNVSSS